MTKAQWQPVASGHRSGGAYYNEIDPFAAAWLRELIAAGHIAPGVVDERDIRDVRPDELAGFRQCHFFAGIGVWSYALRRAGWPDDGSIWTASCPCQPFSAAGKGDGFTDERHLWPALDWLIRQCEPELIIGEQVASGAANDWLDLVQADLEGMDYAFGCVPFPSAGVGAPHIRDRAYWVANAESGRRQQQSCKRPTGVQSQAVAWRIFESCDYRPSICGMANADVGNAGPKWEQRSGPQRQFSQNGSPLRLGDAHNQGPQVKPRQAVGCGTVWNKGSAAAEASAVNGFWGNAQWIWCSDDRRRPVEPGTFPLAHGAPARVGRLRGYGNALNAEAAKVFIEAVMDHLSAPLEQAA